MRENSAQYVFVVSVGHSGSTLLDMILGSHSEALSLGEITRIQDELQRERLCTCGNAISECRFWRQVIHRLRTDSRYSLDISVRMVDQSGIVQKLKVLLMFFGALWSPPWLMRAFMELLNDKRMANSQRLYDTVNQIGGTRIAIDSSKNPFRAKLMYLQCPTRVKVIHLVRDGRGVMVSLMKPKVHNSLSYYAFYWLGHWLATRTMLCNIPASRKLLVHYEHIIADPDREIRRICHFLNIPFDESMLSFREIEHHNIHGNPMRFRKEGIYRQPRTWEGRLGEKDLRTFERIAGVLNRRLGYS
jgi:hypothetical protein